MDTTLATNILVAAAIYLAVIIFWGSAVKSIAEQAPPVHMEYQSTPATYPPIVSLDEPRPD